MDTKGERLMTMKRVISIFIALIVAVGLLPNISVTAETINNSKQLTTKGNKLVYADDETVEVTLSGVNVCGCEWLGHPENGYIKTSLKVALNDWNCNIIRLGVTSQGWWGRYDYIHDGGKEYREYIDDVIEQVGAAGKYIILDLHEYNFVSQDTITFWEDAAVRYKNNPAVLFGLLNEPTGITWDEWRNGNGGENIGEQKLIETIRELGAKNLLVVGGISWSGDLRGIVGENNYAVKDCGTDGDMTKAGYGIMYDCHIYPYASSTEAYDTKYGEARKLYPILIGEYGWDPKDTVIMGNNPLSEKNRNYHTKWFYELYAWMNDDLTYGAKANSTAWCFHPSSSPRLLMPFDENGVAFGGEGYSYPPTEFFGVYAKEYLEAQMGQNIMANKAVVSYTLGRPSDALSPNFAIDEKLDTYWACGASQDKELVVDLGAEFNVTRWQLSHGGTLYAYDLMLSRDGENWSTADSIVNEKYGDNTDRYIRPTVARFAKLSITDDNLLAKVYNFALIGKDTNESAVSDMPDAEDISGVVAAYNEVSFYDGETLGCWYSHGNYPEYIENASEDGKGAVMRLTGYTTPMLALINDNFRSFVNFDYFQFKYKSNYNVSLRLSMDYQATDEKSESKTVELSSTNGEWRTVKITTEDLMPKVGGEWIKTSMQSIYSSEYSAFMPVIIMHMNTNGTGSVDFEYIRGVWNMQGGLQMNELAFTNQGINCNSGITSGKTDVTVRYGSKDYSYMNGVFVAAASYNANGQLIDTAVKRFNIAPDSNCEPFTLSVFNDGSGYIKIFTWRDTQDQQAIIQAVTYDSEGVRYN